MCTQYQILLQWATAYLLLDGQSRCSPWIDLSQVVLRRHPLLILINEREIIDINKRQKKCFSYLKCNNNKQPTIPYTASKVVAHDSEDIAAQDSRKNCQLPKERRKSLHRSPAFCALSRVSLAFRCHLLKSVDITAYEWVSLTITDNGMGFVHAGIESLLRQSFSYFDKKNYHNVRENDSVEHLQGIIYPQLTFSTFKLVHSRFVCL